MESQKSSHSIPFKFSSGLRIGIAALVSLSMLFFLCYEMPVLKSQIKQLDDMFRSQDAVIEQLLLQRASDRRKIETMNRTIQMLKEEVCAVFSSAKFSLVQ